MKGSLLLRVNRDKLTYAYSTVFRNIEERIIIK